MTNGNPYYIQPAGNYGPQLMGLAGQIGELKEQQEVRQAKTAEEQRIEALKQGALAAYKEGPEAMRQFSIKNPEMAEILSRMIGFKNEETKQNYIDSIFRTLVNPEKAEEIATERKQYLIDQGLSPEEMKHTNMYINKIRDPDQKDEAIKGLEMELALQSPEMFDRYQKIKGVVPAKDETSDIQNFKHYQTLLRDNPEQAKAFANQVGITDTKPEDKTTAIKEFEYGEKNPKFKLAQMEKLNKTKSKEMEGKTFENSSKLRKEFLGESKDYKKVRDSFARVEGSTKDPSAAGDLSLIFNYMKMLDPGSVVRESEFATAAATGSYGERMKAAVLKIWAGERLSPSMRKDFVEKASVLMEGMQKQHTKREENYRNIAEKNMLPVDEVVVDITTPTGIEEEPAHIEAPQSAINFLINNPQYAEEFRKKYGYLPEEMQTEGL
jgi:hypothetical protein